MSRLARRDPAMLGDHHLCHKCGDKSRYIHKDTHWCRVCLDIEQYPALAHLSQEERDALRLKNVEGKMNLINTNSVMGFAAVTKK